MKPETHPILVGKTPETIAKLTGKKVVVVTPFDIAGEAWMTVKPKSKK